VPAAVQVHPGLRLEQNDASGVYLSDIFDQHCEEMGVTREEPMIAVGEKVKQAVREFKQVHGRGVRSNDLQRYQITESRNRPTRMSSGR
jgi:transformation/transcription domain-associated protein